MTYAEAFDVALGWIAQAGRTESPLAAHRMAGAPRRAAVDRGAVGVSGDGLAESQTAESEVIVASIDHALVNDIATEIRRYILTHAPKVRHVGMDEWELDAAISILRRVTFHDGSIPVLEEMDSLDVLRIVIASLEEVRKPR